MKLIRPLAALALFVASALPALAADAVYPPGLRLGMVPLVGLSKAKTFPGFENEDGSVKVLITELPPAAYNEVVSAFNANPAGANGGQGVIYVKFAGDTAFDPVFFTIS